MRDGEVMGSELISPVITKWALTEIDKATSMQRTFSIGAFNALAFGYFFNSLLRPQGSQF